jgi:hypothetical protein
MAAARSDPQVTYIPFDGSVLVTGGVYSGFVYPTEVEVYRPTTGTFTTIGNMPGRRFHTATAYSNRGVLVAGGYKAGVGTLDSMYVIDVPSSLVYGISPPMLSPRSDHNAVHLGGGDVLFVGGEDGTAFATDLERYNVNSGLQKTFPGPAPRSRALANVVGGTDLLVFGGHDGTDYVKTTESIDLATLTIRSQPDLDVARGWGASAVALDGRVFTAGGANTNAIEFFTPTTVPGQTPWKSISGSYVYTNIAWDYALGYRFEPQVDGQIYALGGLFAGTKTVKLFHGTTLALLAETQVTSSNDFAYAAIPEVPVTAGTEYIVAVYLAGSGGAYELFPPQLPETSGDIEILASAVADTSGDPNAIPSTNHPSAWYMFGIADVGFRPN